MGESLPDSFAFCSPAEMSETAFRYTWRKSFDDAENDFLAHDGEVTIGRIRMETRHPVAGRWLWNLQAFHGAAIAGQMNGYMLGSPREVAAFLEDHYDRMAEVADGLHALTVRGEMAFFERKGLPLPPGVLWRKARFIDRVSDV